MSGAHKAIDALKSYYGHRLKDMEHDPEWRVREMYKSPAYKSKVIIATGNDRDPVYFVKDGRGDVICEEVDFTNAMRNLMPAGNAAAKGFIAITTTKVGTPRFAAFSYKGTPSKTCDTMGEAEMKLKTLERLEPKLSMEEQQDRAREWMRLRILQGVRVQGMAKLREVEEQKKKIEEEKQIEEMVEQGFGAW